MEALCGPSTWEPEAGGSGFQDRPQLYREIAASLEDPQRSLEESLKLYEEGVGLIAFLEKTVERSKLKLEKLTAGQEEQAEE